MNMTPEEKIEEAKTIRCMTYQGSQYPQERANEASIEFIKLEVQLATLLLGLTSIFWNSYSGLLPDGEHLGIFTKISFALVLFFLIGSIMLGLLYLKIVERYWDRITNNRARRFEKWQKVVRKEANFEEAVSFQEGANTSDGLMTYTPEWPWIIQTILLLVSLGIIFCLAVKLIIVN